MSVALYKFQFKPYEYSANISNGSYIRG